MCRILAAAALVGLSFASLTAQDKAPPTPPASPAPIPVEKLIEQLGDRNFRVREAAAKDLEARGESALVAMRKAAEISPNPEIRRRLQGMIGNLERALALAPKQITLSVKNRPLHEVITAVAKQTGYSMQFQGGNRGNLATIDVRNGTFWEVMDRLCMDHGLILQHNEGMALQIYQQDNIWPYVCYRGPFKVVANNFYYNKTITLGGLQRNPTQNQPRSEGLQFSFNIQSEPKLPLMNVGQPKLLEAVDDLGNSMVQPAVNHEVYYGNNGYRTFNYTSQVQLTWPNKEAKTVKVLRGSIPVTLLAQTKPEIVVNDITKVKNKKFTGSHTELNVDEMKDTNNKQQYQIKMTVRNTAPNAQQDYSWANSVHQRIELFDAKGNRYYSQGYNWENSSTGYVQATFMYGTNGDAAIGPPVKLVFNYWGMLQHQIDFEFKNLPLP